jgi:lipase maturation factor 1
MVFSRLFAFIFFIAFASLFTQWQALFSSNGISPIQDLINRTSFFQLPSLFHFFSSDTAIGISASLGLVISGLLGLRILSNKILRASLFGLLYFIYLSFVNTGGVFLSFQWDILLLESSFLMIIYELCRGDIKLEQLVKYLFWVLIFKLMFMSGLVKLSSGDESWKNLSALQYHYQTQPLPNPFSGLFHKLPTIFHYSSCILMFFIELVVPFFIFFGKRMRHIAGLSFILLQLMIVFTGNYCFFNLLTILLCIPLLDIDFLKPIKLKILRSSEEVIICNPSINSFLGNSNKPNKSWSYYLILFLVIIYSSISIVHIIHRSGLRLAVIDHTEILYLKSFGRFYLNNPYGLFAVMTTKRYEIIFQGTRNISGKFSESEWVDYEFKYKPGDLNRMPAQIAPFQPRLDWQMWFAALSDYKQNPWLVNFAVKLLEGNPAVLGLLAHNPYPNKPPDHIRALIYEYRFSSSQDQVWQRELKGQYLPNTSLRGLR